MSDELDDVLIAAQRLRTSAARDEDIDCIEAALHQCFLSVKKLRAAKRGKMKKCTDPSCGSCVEYNECELTPIFIGRQL